MDYTKDYYSVLGVKPTATDAEIKKAYRNLQKKYHPDRNPDNKQAEEKSKEASEAYDVLGDPSKKTEYENMRHGGRGFGGFSGRTNYNPTEGFGDIRDIFEQFGGYTREEQFSEDLDLELEITIPFSKIYNNEKVDITYKRNVPCTTCDGTGTEDSDESVECLHCEGKGAMNYYGTNIKCKYCKGQGKIHSKHCTTCSGTKMKPKNETIPINNTFKIGAKKVRMTQKGYGNFSKHYPGRRGNLIVTINPEQIDGLERKGVTLYQTIDVDFRQAILGAKIPYKHLDNKDYNITIPERTTDGSTLRMKNKGMLYPNGTQRGDLIFKMNIVVNYDDLNVEDISALKKEKID